MSKCKSLGKKSLLIIFISLFGISSACSSVEKNVPKPDYIKVKKSKNLKHSILAKTWDFWDCQEKFENAGFTIDMLGKKELVIPSELRFKEVDAEKLIIETAKFNNGLEVLFSKNRKRVLFYRKSDPEKIGQIKKGLDSKTPNVRLAAIRQAGKMPVAGLVLPILEVILTEKSGTLRRKALEVFAYEDMNSCTIYTQDNALEILCRALNDRDMSIQRYALKAIGEMKGDIVIKLLKSALKHKKWSVRIAGLEALKNFYSDKDIRKLVSVAFKGSLKNEYLYAPEPAYEFLKRLDKEKAFKLHVKALESKELNIKRNAIFALAYSYGEEGLEHLRKKLKRLDDENETNSIDVSENKEMSNLLNLYMDVLGFNIDFNEKDIVILGEIGGEKSLSYISKFLNSKNQEYVEAARTALGRIGGDKAVELLAIGLNDYYWYSHYHVLDTLGNIGGEKALDHIEIALVDIDCSILESAVRALGNIGGERAVKLLAKAIQDDTESTRCSAIFALEKIDGKKATLVIGKALYDSSAEVREAAAEALGNLANESAIKLLRKSLKHEDEEAGDAKFNALRKIIGN